MTCKDPLVKQGFKKCFMCVDTCKWNSNYIFRTKPEEIVLEDYLENLKKEGYESPQPSDTEDS